MKRVYVAGPFRATNGYQLKLNIDRAEEMAYFTAKAGAIPICPHTMYHHFDRTLTAQYWIDATLELLRLCDAVIVCQGWRSSEGTMGEIAEATRMRLPVFYSIGDLEDWLTSDQPATWQGHTGEAG
jgi:nucleoside 2-deoxyribosyltransferase